MNIKKTIASGVAIAGLLAVSALPTFAASDKGPMYDNPTGSCAVGGTGGTAVEGFANLNEVGTNVQGVVSLKGANPGATYTVYLVDGGCTTFTPAGTITTNCQGNENLSINK